MPARRRHLRRTRPRRSGGVRRGPSAPEAPPGLSCREYQQLLLLEQGSYLEILCPADVDTTGSDSADREPTGSGVSPQSRTLPRTGWAGRGIGLIGAGLVLTGAAVLGTIRRESDR